MTSLMLTAPALELLRTAEKLFAARGVDAVSLREISAASGQKNHSAAQYYFKDKAGLIDALVLRHSIDLQDHWIDVIDAMRAENVMSLERLVELLVRAVAAKLDDEDGGVAFVRISAQLVAHPTMPLLEMTAARTAPPLYLAEAMLGFIEIPPELLAARMERVAGTMYNALAPYAVRPSAMSREAFLHDLIDCLVALITTPPSSNTQAMLDDPEQSA